MLVEPALMLSLFVGGLVTTVAVGAPIASSLVRPFVFRRPARRDEPSLRDRNQHQTGFSPLDLGPDPVEWPSAKSWQSSADRRLPEWPSLSWDDEHFGAHWRDGRADETDDLGFHAMAQRRYDASRSSAEALAHNAQPAAKERSRTPSRSSDRSPRRASRTQPGVRRSATPLPTSTPEAESSSPKVSRASRRSPTPASARKTTPSSRSEADTTLPVRQPPSRPELEAMIAQVGLAGTVQAIMQRTGWDFRKAAHYLARVRQGD